MADGQLPGLIARRVLVYLQDLVPSSKLTLMENPMNAELDLQLMISMGVAKQDIAILVFYLEGGH